MFLKVGMQVCEISLSNTPVKNAFIYFIIKCLANLWLTTPITSLDLPMWDKTHLYKFTNNYEKTNMILLLYLK